MVIFWQSLTRRWLKSMALSTVGRMSPVFLDRSAGLMNWHVSHFDEGDQNICEAMSKKNAGTQCLQDRGSARRGGTPSWWRVGVSVDRKKKMSLVGQRKWEKRTQGREALSRKRRGKIGNGPVPRGLTVLKDVVYELQRIFQEKTRRSRQRDVGCGSGE